MLLAVSKNGWDSLPAREQRVMRWAANKVDLGYPAIYVNRVTLARWYTFHDGRISSDDIAWFGVIAAHAAEIAGLNLAQFPADATKAQIKNFIYGYLQARRVAPADVVPAEPAFGPTADEILQAQGAPLAVRGAMNDLWDPYDPETHGEV